MNGLRQGEPRIQDRRPGGNHRFRRIIQKTLDVHRIISSGVAVKDPDIPSGNVGEAHPLRTLISHDRITIRDAVIDDEGMRRVSVP